jgi:hypothetical protein
MLVEALETEVAAYLEAHRDERDGEGRALVVRNGVTEKSGHRTLGSRIAPNRIWRAKP